jgi:AcrR family transcriptional regulator
MTAPLRADAERNRQRLLAAAKELFAARGLDVTLDEIARHAGVGTGTAYRRFANKDALIDALMVDRVGELAAIAREGLAEPDPGVALTSFFERALALMAADRGLTEVLFSPGRGRERGAHARGAPVVGELVERAVAAGAVRSDIAMTDVPVINFMLYTVVDFAREVEPELYKRYLRIVLDGLRPRDDLDPLPAPALSFPVLQRAMASWPH